MLITSNFKRYTGRMNIDNEFNKYLKVGATMSYARTNESIINNDGINGVVMQAALMSPKQYRFCMTLTEIMQDLNR